MFEHSSSPEIATPDAVPLPASPTRAERLAAARKPAAPQLAPWQQISGITPENELTLPPRERRQALRKLIAKATDLAREELVEGASCPLVGPEGTATAVGMTRAEETRGQDAPSTNDYADATFLWDPMRSVCRQLGISHSKLSSLSKELTGMSAHEIADRIKVAGIKEKLRAPLIEFAANLWGTPGHAHFANIDNYIEEELKLDLCEDFSETSPLRRDNDKRSYDQKVKDRQTLEKLAKKRDGLLINIDHSPYPGRCCQEEIRWELFRALKKSRREPDFDRNTWAMSLGFANYARFRRACLLEYNKTPHQLEMEILGELADFYDLAGNLKLRICTQHRRPESRGEPAAKPYYDRWAAAREFRFDWLKARVAEFGVSASLRDE